MKKFIISTLAVVIGLALFSTTAFADASFNSPGEMPTVTVTNATTQPCSFGAIDGCWKSSTTAQPGDMIAVHLYFKNTSNETANNVMLGIEPSRSGTAVTFNGGVAATNAPRATGTAYATLSQVETITNMSQSGPYQADWYSSANSAPQPVDTDELFAGGFPIGSLAPGQQGVLVVRFLVNGTPNNGGGGTTPPPPATCSINNFSAAPSTINLGDSSTLSWNTSNCNYVSISTLGSNLTTDGSQIVYPTNTTTYRLTAYPGGATATAIVTVNNNNNNNGGGTTNNCLINSFNANPSTINSGDTSNLNWVTSGCTSVSISSLGSVSTTGSQAIYPYNTTTYTLTAAPGNQTATTTVTVLSGNNNNNNYCSINSFYVDSNSITQGQTTTLHWSTSGTSSVYLTGFGNENSSGSMSISPYQSTSYTLTLNGNNCSGGGSQSQSVYVTVSQQQYYNSNPIISAPVQTQPQAITTVAAVLGSYSAQLNGIAVPNISYGTTNAWFEYGPTTSLGSRTDQQAVNGFGTYPYSANISGLIPGATYYYRAAVQNQNGIAYGSVVPFTTTAASTYTPPTKVYVQSQTVTRAATTTANTGLVAESQPSLFKLEVDSNVDHMCIGGTISYTVNYQNISNEDLENSVLRITLPGELTYASSSQGDYDVTDRTVTISLGEVQPGEQGSVTVTAQVNDQAVVGKLAVITATMVYTNPVSHAQEQAIAYSLVTVSNDCPSVLGASVFGFGGFLPQTLLAWLLLILVILALIVLARSLYHKKEEPAKTA
jgi:uncharacterized repeat protein (TIGR01451 family)